MCWNVLAKRAIKYDTWLPAQVTKSEATPCQQFPAKYCWVVGPDNNQGRSTMRVKTRWCCCCSPINQSIIASSRDLEVASQGPSYWPPSAWFEIQSSLLSPFVTSDFSRSQNLTRPKRGHKMLPAPGWLILVAGFKEHLPHLWEVQKDGRDHLLLMEVGSHLKHAEVLRGLTTRIWSIYGKLGESEERERRGWWTSSWAGLGDAEGDCWTKHLTIKFLE